MKHHLHAAACAFLFFGAGAHLAAQSEELPAEPIADLNGEPPAGAGNNPTPVILLSWEGGSGTEKHLWVTPAGNPRGAIRPLLGGKPIVDPVAFSSRFWDSSRQGYVIGTLQVLAWA